MQDAILCDIFKSDISIAVQNDIKTYTITFKNKEYTINIDASNDTIVNVSEDLQQNVLDKYKSEPMIYNLVYECIKKNELNLETQDEFVSKLEFNDIEKITEKQFREYMAVNRKHKIKKEGNSGKEIFLMNKEMPQ